MVPICFVYDPDKTVFRKLQFFYYLIRNLDTKVIQTLLKRTALCKSIINTISRYVLLLRQNKLQFRWIPHQLLCHLLRHPNFLHHRHVHHHAPQPLEVILLSNIKVRYITSFVTLINQFIFSREGLKAKKRVTALVFAVILVFIGKWK